MLGGCLVHPDSREVVPICPEAIVKEDGDRKNDCERNAAVRFLKDFRREHPHLKVIVVEDALASNGPHVKLLQKLNLRFILGVKSDGNRTLFKRLSKVKSKLYKWGKSEYEVRYVNGVPLNGTHRDLLVNFIECWEYKVINGKRKRCYHNSWVTDIQLTDQNLHQIIKGGRARWSIENETFNTLKNQDYHFEHNFGHGYENLSTNFALLMMLAFLVDQAQQMACRLFQAAKKKLISRVRLWERLRNVFRLFIIQKWSDLWKALAGCYNPPDLVEVMDTS